MIANFRRFDRVHALLKLAHLASVLANSPGSIMGERARAWTRDLLVERRESGNPVEVAVGTALDALPLDRAVAHAHVVFLLQVLALVHGGTAGEVPHDGYLALMMLAGNDYIPEWAATDRPLGDMQDALASIVLCASFNRSDDLVRTLVRTVDIMGQIRTDVSRPREMGRRPTRGVRNLFRGIRRAVPCAFAHALQRLGY